MDIGHVPPLTFAKMMKILKLMKFLKHPLYVVVVVVLFDSLNVCDKAKVRDIIKAEKSEKDAS